MTADHGVLQGRALELDLDHILARALHGLLDSHRDLARLPGAVTDATLAVAHHRQGRETELTTTLDHLGDAVYRHQLFE